MNAAGLAFCLVIAPGCTYSVKPRLHPQKIEPTTPNSAPSPTSQPGGLSPGEKPAPPEPKPSRPKVGAIESLARFAPLSKPWFFIEANSEQRQPFHVGATPREIEILGRTNKIPHIAEPMIELAEAQARVIAARLGEPRIEFELWPTREEHRLELTWVFARWRTLPTQNAEKPGEWAWLEASLWDSGGSNDPAAPGQSQPEKLSAPPVFPQIIRPWLEADFARLFFDFTTLSDLDSKPLFGDCLWLVRRHNEVEVAWLPNQLLAVFRDRIKADPHRQICLYLPQPARLNADSLSFKLTVTAETETGTAPTLQWAPTPNVIADAKPETSTDTPAPSWIKAWPPTLTERYLDDIRTLTGEKEVTVRNEQIRFTRKNSAQKDHQLERLMDFLEDRYAALGIETRRQRFEWMGIPQSNLVAVIQGSLPPELNRPVLMADHIDTAFATDVFDFTGARISIPGANDNASATAALLRAAEILPAALAAAGTERPLHDIWLTHLTGKEYPADGLGARRFVERLLDQKQDLSALVILDLIAHRIPEDRVFQVNAGQSQESIAAAALALQAARAQAPEFQAAFRSYYDPRSYLYNTDGLVFADAGFPVVYFNEHLNRFKNIERHLDHKMTDQVDFVDPKTGLRVFDTDYALAIVKTAIETVARLSMRP